MSSLVAYLNSLVSEKKTFEDIKEIFEGLGCKIIDNISSYMIFAHNDVFLDKTKPQFLQEAVGSIFTKDTNKLICFGFPKTFDYSNDIKFEDGKIVASEYIDGSLIRAYWDGSFWRLSTNGSINAYDSYWISEKSFGELFDNCLSRIYKYTTTFNKSPLVEKLDKSCCYQFLIKHPAVHIDQTTKPFIYHVGTFDLTNLCYVEKTSLNTFRKPRTFLFHTMDELTKNLKDDVKGFVFYSEKNIDTQMPRYKLLSERFMYLRKLIGNTPNLYFRYLECKNEGTATELLLNFPSMKYYSSWVDRSISEIVRNAYNIYVEKYIKRQYTMFINYFYRPILRDIHTRFIETKEKITYQIVYNIINSYHPKRLLFILNGLKYLNTNNVIDPTMQSISNSGDWGVKSFENEIKEQTEADKKNEYGNILYPLIIPIVGNDNAPKICGMILEMNLETLKELTENSEELKRVSLEAMELLKESS